MSSPAERRDEPLDVGGADADERAAGGRVAWRRDRRAELVEPVEQALGEPPDVRLDRRHAGAGDELEARDTCVEGRHRGCPGVEAPWRSRAASSRRSTSRRCPRRRTSRSASGRASRGAPACTHMNPSPAVPSRYFTVPPVTTSAPSVAHVQLDRAARLVAVGQDERTCRVCRLRDRRHVVAVPRAVGERRAADERGALVDRRGELLGRDRPVVARPHVDDLRTTELLRVGDLADRRELVLADHDPVALAVERQRRDKRADALRDRRRDRDVVCLGVEQPRDRASERLVPVDPEAPFGPVRVPAREPLVDCRADGVRERALRARVEVGRGLEDRKLVADRGADTTRLNGQGMPFAGPRRRAASPRCPRGRRGPSRERSRGRRSRARRSRSARRRASRRLRR